MTRSQRMHRIASMSRSAERVAGQALATSKQQLEMHRKQLADLISYREDYRAMLKSGSAHPMSGAEAQKLRAFINQVDTVIGGLQSKIEHTERRYNGDLEQWTQQFLRSNTLEGIANEALKKEREVEEEIAQREIDDRRPVKMS